MNLKPKSYKLSAVRGFTLAELLVSVSIFVVLTAIVLVKNSQFNSSILVTNLAYEVALTIRQAQVFGLSVRETALGSGTTFQAGYGVHFDTGNPSSFIFFADIPTLNTLPEEELRIYDSSNPDELLNTFNITGGHIIYKFCVTVESARHCSSIADETNADIDLSFLDITFVRPAPEPIFRTDLPDTDDNAISSSEIYIESPQGRKKRVSLQSTGQISIDDVVVP